MIGAKPVAASMDGHHIHGGILMFSQLVQANLFCFCFVIKCRWTSDLQLNYITKLGTLDRRDIQEHNSRKICQPETLNTKPYTLNRPSSYQCVHLPSDLARLEDGLFLNPDATCASTCPGARRGSRMEVRRTIRQQTLEFRVKNVPF